MPAFEFDPNKSQSNRTKHGIDFVQAQKLWSDPDLLEVQAASDDEPRHLVIGMISKTYWSAIVTYREANIRIISVRRSRQTEIELYES